MWRTFYGWSCEMILLMNNCSSVCTLRQKAHGISMCVYQMWHRQRADHSQCGDFKGCGNAGRDSLIVKCLGKRVERGLHRGAQEKPLCVSSYYILDSWVTGTVLWDLIRNTLLILFTLKQSIMVSLALVYRKENWGSERLSDYWKSCSY